MHLAVRQYLRVVALVCFAVGAVTKAMSASEPVVRLTAKKFEYSQSTLVLRKGVPVVLEVTALDRVHGFNLPDFGVRTDLLPGRVTRIRLVPDKAGEFVFFCDVFCGDGHEEMSGVLTVRD